MYDVLCLSKASQQKTRRSCVMTLYLMTSSNQCWPHLQACCTCHHRQHDLRQYQPGRDIKKYQLCSNFISFNARNHTSQKISLGPQYQDQAVMLKSHYGTSTGSNKMKIPQNVGSKIVTSSSPKTNIPQKCGTKHKTLFHQVSQIMCSQ